MPTEMKFADHGDSKIINIEADDNIDEPLPDTSTCSSDEITFDINELDADKSKQIFYKLAADTSFLLSDKIFIKVNKSMFYFQAKSNAIFQMLFGPLKEDVVEITDIDSVTFKLFLDCIMGFTPYTFNNAFKIFPVAWKYQIDKSIKDCINVLEPTTMNENVCHCLNMAVFCNCENLIDRIIDYIYIVYNPYKFLENETYCFLLEPDSLVQILKVIYLDSFMMKVIIQWGCNYLERNKSYVSLKALFEACKIVQYFKESVLFDFGIPYLTNDLDTSNHFLSNIFSKDSITSMLLNLPDFEGKKMEWKNIVTGDSFTEEIIMQSVVCEKPVNLIYKIQTNNFIIYDALDTSKINEIVEININVDEENEETFIFDIQGNKAKHNYKTFISIPRFFVKSNSLHNSCTSKIFKINYNFPCNCKILLRNRSDDSKKLYFTKNVTLIGVS